MISVLSKKYKTFWAIKLLSFDILLVVLFKEINLLPEVFSSPRFRTHRRSPGCAKRRTAQDRKLCV